MKKSSIFSSILIEYNSHNGFHRRYEEAYCQLNGLVQNLLREQILCKTIINQYYLFWYSNIHLVKKAYGQGQIKQLYLLCVLLGLANGEDQSHKGHQ